MAENDGQTTSAHPTFSRDHIMGELEEHGFCVIPGIASAQECDQYISEYRNWLSQFQGDNWPFQIHSIIQTYRIGHFEATWKARLKTRTVFEEIWQTKKLLTSIDGVSISPPPEEGTTAYGTDTNWFHLDQSSSRSGLHAYQGALYLENTTQTDYCFRVLSGSHQYNETFFETYDVANKKSRGSDFYKLHPDEVNWFKEKGCNITKVPVPKGGLVLWDSRTVHDNARPEFGRPNKDRWRFVVFSCMTPAIWATPKDLAVKRNAYKNLLMTAHWPSQGIFLFNSFSGMHISPQKTLEKMPEIACNDDVRRLCGAKQYDFEDDQSNGPEWEPKWQT